MNILKNRTIAGLACIIVSLAICFGLTPVFNGALKSKTKIVRITKEVKKGEKIELSKIETVEVGKFNLPDQVVKKGDDVLGKYATADLQKGDYILNTKVSDKPLAEFEYLNTLDGSKQAMSVTIKTFAAGLSGKLEAGDIVSIISADFGELRTTVVPPELQYVKVLAVTSDNGADKELGTDKKKEDEEKKQPATVSLLVTPAQAKILAELEAKGKIHIALVYRGDKENAQKFIKLQDDFLQKQSSGLDATKINVQGDKVNG